MLTGIRLERRITRTTKGPKTNIAVVRWIYELEIKFIRAAKNDMKPTK
jgi:hypothetical protein